MKILELVASIISIASGVVSILSAVGISKTPGDTKTLIIQSETLWIALSISVVVFAISLLLNRKALTATITTIKSQVQFGGKNNSQNMR